MSELLVTSIYNQEGDGSPNFPKGATVTGVVTATSFSGSGANLTGIDATSLKDGSGNVKIQANSTGAVVTGILTVSSNVSVGGTLTYEDVTNIDSVGMVTARQGIKVTGGGINVSSGVVTATSFSGSGANLTGIDAAPNISMTAGEAITAEDSLEVSTNGTAIKVTGVVPGFGSVIDGSGSGDDVIYAKETCAFGYDESKNQYVMLYNNGAQSEYLYGVVMTPTSSGDMMDVGVPALILNSAMGGDTLRYRIVMEYNPDKQGLFYMVYRSDNSGRLKYGMLAISGTGTSATLSVAYSADVGSNSDMGPGGAAYNTTEDTLAIAYTYIGEGAPYEAHMRMITYPTASSISDVGTTEVTGGYGYNTDLAYNSAENCYLIVFRDNSDEGWGRVVINNGSNNGFTYPAAKTLLTSGDDWKSSTGMRIAYDPNTNKFLGVYVKKNTNELCCRYITCTAAGAITSGDKVSVTTNAMDGWFDYEVVFNKVTKTFVIAYNYGSNTGTTLRTAKISGTTITLGEVQTVQSTYTPQFTALGTAGNTGKVIVGYNNPPSATDDFKGKVYTLPQTTLSNDTFLGFAASTVANGAPVKIKIAGNTSTRVGLSSGTAYYVQSDGTIGTTPVDNNSVKAGVAVNSTTLLIRQ